MLACRYLHVCMATCSFLFVECSSVLFRSPRYYGVVQITAQHLVMFVRLALRFTYSGCLEVVLR